MMRTLGGALAAAVCGATLMGAPAQAATVAKAEPLTPTMASDCYLTHHYNGYWHRHPAYVCGGDYYDSDYYDGDYAPGYYDGGYRGYGHGGFGHGGFGHGGFRGGHGRR